MNTNKQTTLNRVDGITLNLLNKGVIIHKAIPSGRQDGAFLLTFF